MIPIFIESAINNRDIFIDDKNTIVSFQKNAQAFDETSLPSNSPAKYVIEVNAGLADKWQLKIGNTISYTH